MAWLDDIIKNGINELNGETDFKREYAFSRVAISHIPLISYIGLTDDNCKFIREQAAEVLKSSIQNAYKEVAITFDLNATEHLTKIFGDYSSVPLLKDKETRELITSKSNDTVIVTTHNHSNNSIFSLNDLFIFAENPNIKLMNIINGKGEISFLMRSPQTINLHNSVLAEIYEYVNDFKTRVVDFYNNNPEKELVLSDILTFDERAKTVNSYLRKTGLYGIYYENYLGEEEAKTLVFLPLAQTSDTTFVVDNKVDISVNELKNEGYYENGEDGYEWE